MSGTNLYSFTPSMHDHAFLETIFVARQELAERLLERIRLSATTAAKYYMLVIGPRGIGKTHLVALLYHRIRTDAALDAALRIAWLQEDPWSIASYPHLLLSVLQQLASEYRDHPLIEEIVRLQQLPAAAFEHAAEEMLRRSLGDKTLLILAENFDEICKAIGNDGQHKLRAFLQTYANTTILATSTSLLDPIVADQERPFYGGFTRAFLKPLSFEEAVQMLMQIARHSGAEQLAAMLNTSVGRARVRAIHHLAGGNPRIYVIFHQFLTRETLDELVEPFMKLVNELTPYYQGRMQSLAPMQRNLVDIIRRSAGPLPVKEIAAAALHSPQAVSNELVKLRDLGYVQALQDGRLSRYELREPLMRIALNTKEQRGDAIPLFVAFLRAWFPRVDLMTMLDQIAPSQRSHRAALEAALASGRDPLVAGLAQEFQHCVASGNHAEAAELGRELLKREPQDFRRWITLGTSLKELGDEAALHNLWQEAVQKFPDESFAWNQLDFVLKRDGRFEEALAASGKALALGPKDGTLAHNHAYNLLRLGRKSEAMEVAARALERLAETSEESAGQPEHLFLLSILQRHREVITTAIAVLEKSFRDTDAWRWLALSLDRLGYYQAANNSSYFLTELCPEDEKAWRDTGVSLRRLGRVDEAIGCIEHALQLSQKHHANWMHYAIYLSFASRLAEAQTAFEKGCTLDSTRASLDLYWVRSDILMALGQWEQGRQALIDWLQELQTHHMAVTNYGGIVSLLLKTQSPEVWKRYISTWLEVFDEVGLLAELGSILVRGFPRFAIPWLGPSVARQWYDSWQAMAAHREAMHVPLKLLSVAVTFAEQHDKRILLQLPVEQRSLLEPVIAQYIHALGDQPDETDRAVQQLLHTSQRQLRLEQERTSWQKIAAEPPPVLETTDYARILHTYRARQRLDHALRPLMYTAWQALSKQQARQLLQTAVPYDDNLARALAQPHLDIQRIDKRAVSFSPWTLYQVHVNRDGQQGALDLIAGDDGACLLDGFWPLLHDLIARGIINIQAHNTADYVRFFCNVFRGEDGRYEIVEPAARALVQTLRRLAKLPALQELTPQDSNDTDLVYHTCMMLHAAHLWEVKLVVSGTGVVLMTNDTPIAGPLALQRERFEGPWRFWEAD